MMTKFQILLVIGMTQFFLAGANADQLPKFLDVARNSSGSIKTMNLFNAYRYCKCQTPQDKAQLGCTTLPNSAHLPSARELALLAMSSGAKGIVTHCGTDPWCRLVKVTNADGTKDSFAYSQVGFNARGANNIYFWSSSSSANGYYIYLGGTYGGLQSESSNVNSFGVRCVVGP